MTKIFDFDAIRGFCGYRNPMTASSPPEPSGRVQLEQEGAEFMAGEDFDDMSKEAIEFVLDCPDLIEPILKAAVQRNIYGDASILLKQALASAIAKAREEFINCRMEGRV